jgi:hypothetical protein
MNKNLILLTCVIVLTCVTDAKSVLDYFEDRDRILELEDATYLGSDLTLTSDEVVANEHLMDYKVRIESPTQLNLT